MPSSLNAAGALVFDIGCQQAAGLLALTRPFGQHDHRRIALAKLAAPIGNPANRLVKQSAKREAALAVIIRQPSLNTRLVGLVINGADNRDRRRLSIKEP